MSGERLDALFNAPIISHLLVFTDSKTGAETGVATLYLEGDRLAYYYYAFYDLAYFDRNLGMFMMTSAVEFFAGRKVDYLHLGTCYSQNALYKTQFKGSEFFNGYRWSDNLAELKHIIGRDGQASEQHLLETEAYRQLFCPGGVPEMTAKSRFTVRL